MFGLPTPDQFIKAREEANRLPRKTVSRQTFIRKAMAAGMTQRDAEMQARVNVGLGRCATRIGDEMLTVRAAKRKAKAGAKGAKA
jgi:hypothetical protein